MERERKDKNRLSARAWATLCKRYGGRCLACGSTGGPLVAALIVPPEQGGRAGGIGNVQPLCSSCASIATGDYRPKHNQYADDLTPEKRAAIRKWNRWAARIGIA